MSRIFGKLFETADTMTGLPHAASPGDAAHAASSGSMDHAAEPAARRGANTAVSADGLAESDTAVSELQAIAAQFNAAFNTMLYELESARKLNRQHETRIDELNESIAIVNSRLVEETGKSRINDEKHAHKTEELVRRIHEIETERDRLQQQASMQKSALSAGVEEAGRLSQRIAELSKSLDQRMAEGVRTREEFAREKDLLTSRLEGLQIKASRADELNETINVLSKRIDEETGKNRGKDEAHARQIEELLQRVQEIEAERERLEQQTIEQQAALDKGTEDGTRLQASIEELNSSLDRVLAEGQQAREEFAREKDALTCKIDELQEKSGRVDELNESINLLNSRLEEETAASRVKDEGHARQTEQLQQRIGEIESERQQLQQQISEQQAALSKSAGESARLGARIDELNSSLEQQQTELRQAEEEFARQKDALSADLDELRTKYASTCELLDASQQEKEELSRLHRGELEALQHAKNKLIVELEKLQAVNHALNESITRDSDTHTAVVAQKDSEIEALRASMTAAGSTPEAMQAAADAAEALKAELHETRSRLADAAAQNQLLEERVGSAHGLESEVDRLGKELQDAEQALQRNAADGEQQQALRAQVADLQSALDSARAESDELGKKLLARKSLEEEVIILRETLRQTSSRERQANDASASVDSLKKEVNSLKSALAATREKYARLKAASPRPADGDATKAAVQNAFASAATTDREQFIHHLNELLAHPGNAAASHTVMYILMDSFIRIRDEIGIMNSEKVISDLFGIFARCCDGNDIITRFGDYTFAILTNDADTETTRMKAESMRKAVENHIFEVAGHSVLTSTSIGICSVRDNDDNAEMVIARADMACESARTSGGNQVLVGSTVNYGIGKLGHAENHPEVVSQILEDERIKIYYQSISSLKDMDIHCYEVLTRIVDEEGNIILPGEFFSMAVNSGKAMDVDLYVIEKIMRLMADNVDRPMKLFVKLTRQTVASQDFAFWVMEKIRKYRIKPEMLVFEAAENLLQSELKNLSMLSTALNKMGCKVAIEHYRMSTQRQHLRHVHADYLKIDSGLVQNIGSKGKCLEKVTEIMEFARSKNYITIAEGVESPACLAMLWELGVNLAQGYFIQAPAGSMAPGADDVEDDAVEENSTRAKYTLG